MTEAADWDAVGALARSVVRDPDAPPQRGATAEELGDLERRLASPLPSSLTTWLLMLNGDTIGEGGVFGARPDEPSLDIAHVRQIFRDEWAAKPWLPVASDGSGNYYVLIDGGPVGSVETTSDPRAVAKENAGSLAAFLLWYLPRS
jgi:hypothetical protein